MAEIPGCREMTAAQFTRERTMRFEPDSPEVTGIRFVIGPHYEGSEPLPLIPPDWPSPDWQTKLGPISQVMPLDYESYAGIVLPWVAYRGGARFEADGVVDAYRFFAGAADTVFVKSGRYGENEATCWAIEREFFFALDNPLADISDTHGLYAIFPRGGPWYIHYPSDTPILYVAGSAGLITDLAQVLDDRLLRLVLTDKYYS